MFGILLSSLHHRGDPEPRQDRDQVALVIHWKADRKRVCRARRPPEPRAQSDSPPPGTKSRRLPFVYIRRRRPPRGRGSLLPRLPDQSWRPPALPAILCGHCPDRTGKRSRASGPSTRDGIQPRLGRSTPAAGPAQPESRKRTHRKIPWPTCSKSCAEQQPEHSRRKLKQRAHFQRQV